MILEVSNAQYDEQYELEREQISQGLKRLKDNTLKLEDKSYASATIYGISSIDALLPLVVKRLEKTKARIDRGNTGVLFAEIRQYLYDLEPLAAAAIGCKVTFDKVFSFKEGSNQLTNVCDSIGIALEDECQMRYYESNYPGLLKVLKDNYWHQSKGTKQKISSIQTVINRYDIKKWNSWGRSLRVRLGT